MRRKASTTADTTRALTISVPACALWSKPQKVIVTARKEAAPTGQPWCQLLPSSAVDTARLLQRNAAAGVTRCRTGFLALGVGVGGGGMDVVAIGDADVVGSGGVDSAGVGVGAAGGVPESLQAASMPATGTAMAAARILPTGLA